MARRSEGDLPAGPRLVIPAGELRAEAVRSGGPGGQNVNKVASQVQLRWNVRESPSLDEEARRRLLERLGPRLTAGGELLVKASGHREQARNLQEARERLSRLVEAALSPPRPRVPTRPTRASRERRLAQKKRRGDRKKDRSIPPESP